MLISDQIFSLGLLTNVVVPLLACVLALLHPLQPPDCTRDGGLGGQLGGGQNLNCDVEQLRRRFLLSAPVDPR
jgi:hypothetical protein